MKKRILTIIAILIATITLENTNFATAHIFQSECDQIFMETLEGILDNEEYGNTQIFSTKEIAYDIYREPLGYIYIFTANEECGYAIVIYNEHEYKLTEIYLNALNPYEGAEGEYIYVNNFIYLIYNNNMFIEADSGNEVNQETLELLSDKAYKAGEGFSYLTEQVYFTYRSESNYEMAKRHPGYYGVGLLNACAPVAGGNIIGFYDRYFTNLIPNFTPGTAMGSLYLYKTQEENVNQMITSLYSFMGTNLNGAGTTITQFKNGINAYCSGKGLTSSFTSCMSGSSFNYKAAKQKMTEGQPIVLFVDTYNVIDLMLTEGRDSLDIVLGMLSHTMAGFGYKEIIYTLSTGVQRKDNYIMVATGLTNRPKGYFNINYNTIIDDVYAINII